MDITILHKYFFQYDLSVFFKINRDVCTHKRHLHTQYTTDIYMYVYFALCIFAFNLFVMGNFNAWFILGGIGARIDRVSSWGSVSWLHINSRVISHASRTVTGFALIISNIFVLLFTRFSHHTEIQVSQLLVLCERIN